MDTLNLAPPTVPSAGAQYFAHATPQAAPPAVGAGAFIEQVVQGLRWTCDREIAALLAQVPALAWAEPHRQGWQRVKHNARREVWHANLQGRAYFLKYQFQDRGWRRLRILFRAPPCRAEWEGGLFARRCGISAVRPLAFTEQLRRGGRRCALLVTEAVEPAQPLNEFWLQLSSDADSTRRRGDTAQLIELLAELIAHSHQAGFEHLDMHAANILVQPLGARRYRTVFVDLQSARRDQPLRARAVVRNLAQLNQWFRRHSSVADRLRFLRAYLRWRNEFETQLEHARPLKLSFDELVHALKVAAQRHATRLWARRDRHSRREGRYYMRLKLPGRWRGLAVAACKHTAIESRSTQMVFDRAWWGQQLAAPLRWFTDASARPCKDSHSAVVARALLEHPDGSLPVIVKRPRARDWRRWLVQLFPASRSRRGWRTGHALLNRDIATARPLAMLERRVGPLVLDSLLVTEAIPGATDLETFLRAQAGILSVQDWAWLKGRICHLLAMHMRRLHERGFRHRDCKASNVLVVRQPQLKLLWIDMDGVRLGRRPTPLSDLRPLVRMHVSLLGPPGLTRTDRVRFLRAYFACFGAPPEAWRTAWTNLVRASAQKLRAKDARRAWKQTHYGRP